MFTATNAAKHWDMSRRCVWPGSLTTVLFVLLPHVVDPWATYLRQTDEPSRAVRFFCSHNFNRVMSQRKNSTDRNKLGSNGGIRGRRFADFDPLYNKKWGDPIRWTDLLGGERDLLYTTTVDRLEQRDILSI